jgi:hypothetical protein
MARLLVTATGGSPQDPPGARPQGKIADARFVARLRRATKRPLAILPWGRAPGGVPGVPPGTGH